MPENEEILLKRCKRCNNEFPATLDFFGKHPTTKDKLRQECKECRREESRAYNAAHGKKHYAEHKEEILSKNKAWRDANPERARESRKASYARHREKRLSSAKQYRESHKEVHRERSRRYYWEHRDACIQRMRAHRAAHLEAYRMSNRRYNMAHREQRRAYSKYYIETHKEEMRAYKVLHRQRDLERRRQYRQAHREQISAYEKHYFATHIEQKRLRRRLRESQEDRILARRNRSRQYRQTERGKMLILARQQRRRAAKLNAGGSFSAEDIKDQFKRQKGLCYYCRGALKTTGKHPYHIDHVIPLTREGGSNALWNIVVTCPTCNLRKSNKLPHEWPEGGRLL